MPEEGVDQLSECSQDKEKVEQNKGLPEFDLMRNSFP